MSSRSGDFLARHVALLMRFAGVVAICSGLIGSFVWLPDLQDRSDGDSLRWGHLHNPFMQFPPFNEPFLDVSMWILLGCSAAAGLGGILLLIPLKVGAWLVNWQARLSVATNGVIVLFIIAAFFYYGRNSTPEHFVGDSTYVALALRTGSIAVDLMLSVFLSSTAVRDYFLRQSMKFERGFEVLLREANGRGSSPQ